MNKVNISRLIPKIMSRYSWLFIFIAAVLVGGLWLFVWLQINYDYARTINEASNETMNLAIAFEEHVDRLLSNADNDLLALKKSYEQGGITDPAFMAIAMNASQNSTYNLVAVYDEQGTVISSYIVDALGVNGWDRQYFQIHRNEDSEQLYIDRPINGIINGQETLSLTRRINRPDGSFGGIVFIGLKVDYFRNFYKQMNLGHDQLIAMVGLDGIVRARQAGDNMNVGQVVVGCPLLKNAQIHPFGTYIANDVVDGTQRIVSYRTIPKYSLVIAVGKTTKDALADFEQRKQSYILGALIAGLFVLGFFGLLIAWIEKQRTISTELQQQVNKRTQEVEAQREELQAQNEELLAKEEELSEINSKLLECNVVIQEEKDWLSALINSISDEVWVTNENAKLTLANPTAIQEFNLSLIEEDVADIVARFEVLRLDGNARPVEEAPPLRALHGEVVKNEGEIVRTPATDEMRYREVSANPVTNSEGKIIGSISIVRDITERMRMEGKLKEKHNQLQEINAILEEEIAERQAAQEALHHAHDALVVTGARYHGLFAHMRKAFLYLEIMADETGQPVDYEIVDVNPSFEKMFGCKADNVLGARLSQVFPGSRGDFFIWLQSYSEEALADISIDFNQQVHFGDKYYQVLAYSPEKGYVAVLINDITEIKQHEVQLKHYSDQVAVTNTELKSFINTIAHDFRSPMVNLKGFSKEIEQSLTELKQTLQEYQSLLPEELKVKVDELLNKEVPDELQFIGSSVDRLNRMVDTLLSLSRIGRREMCYKQVDMNKLVDTVLQSYRHQIDEKQIQEEVGELPIIKTDILTMEQIIGNLVDNAIKYLDPIRQGKIEINCSEDENEYVMSVKDNGRGIATADTEKIFEPFRRSGRQDKPGEGLGLAYVRTLVRTLGGKVWCESEEGLWTKMSFTVPKNI